MSTEQEKVEMEQVPLKSDTDAPAAEETTATATEAPAAKKGGFFSWKKTKKPAAETEETPAEDKAEESKEEKTKKKCWWRRECGEKTEEEQKADHMIIGMNLIDRDEKGINDHVKFGFEDIFGEAETTHSWDCVWRLTNKVFCWTRCFFYKLAALIIALPAAIVFGILFAIVTVFNTFVCVPFGKLLTIPGNWIAKTWNWLIHAVFDPVATSLGLFFSQFTIRKYGINSQPTDPCVA